MPAGMMFDEPTIRYLKKLPAVLDAGPDRIDYDPAFRLLFMILKSRGVSPTDIFRDAGMPPELVGRKRIERCAARWSELGEEDALTEVQRRLLPFPGTPRPKRRGPARRTIDTGRLTELELRVARLERLHGLGDENPQTPVEGE